MSNDTDGPLEAEAPAVASPCIGVCVLNLQDICEGCYRSSDEITRWTAYDNDAKRAVIERSWQRAKKANRLL